MLAPATATRVEGRLAKAQIQPAQIRADHAQVLAEITRYDGHMIGGHDLVINQIVLGFDFQVVILACGCSTTPRGFAGTRAVCSIVISGFGICAFLVYRFFVGNYKLHIHRPIHDPHE